MILEKEDAVFDDDQKAMLRAISPYTEGYIVKATRGHSDPIEQLRLIEFYAKQDDVLLKPFERDNLHGKVAFEGKEVYLWQPTWGALLHLYHTSGGKRGKKINPPLAAECLYDYVNAGVNKKGLIIPASPHISGGKTGKWPIDFSGKLVGPEGQELISLKMVASMMFQAKNDLPIRNVVVEQANNCVHIDL